MDICIAGSMAMKKITVTIEDKHYEEIKALSYWHNKSIKEIINTIMGEFLNKEENKAPLTRG